MDIQNAESPTGCIHRVSDVTKSHLGDSMVRTLCVHKDGDKFSGLGYYHKWPLSDKPVTCKRCLKLMQVKVLITPECHACISNHKCTLDKNGDCTVFLPADWHIMEYLKGKWYKTENNQTKA